MFSKAEDPVCGMQVRKREAVTATVKGKKYFFCSKECKSKFEQNPEKYLKSPEKAK
jgi:YHS domain-containing protein